MPAYFGRPREAVGFREMPVVAAPAGKSCHHCGEPVHADDDGVLDDDRQVWHADCWLLKVLRKLSPSAGTPEIGRQTVRQAAAETVRAFEREGRLDGDLRLKN